MKTGVSRRYSVAKLREYEGPRLQEDVDEEKLQEYAE